MHTETLRSEVSLFTWRVNETQIGERSGEWCNVGRKTTTIKRGDSRRFFDVVFCLSDVTTSASGNILSRRRGPGAGEPYQTTGTVG